MEYKDLVQDVFSNEDRLKFIVSSLRESMTCLGFSEGLINEFLSDLRGLDIDNFINKHQKELTRVQLGHFFGELVPRYFSDHVVPEVPVGGKVLDLGCGMGTLVKIIKNRDLNNLIIGIDIKKAPEWESIVDEAVALKVVGESNFLSVLEKENPDIVTITWVLHHMDFEQQKRYITSLYKVLKEGAVLIVLEDSYSELLTPESGLERYNDFMKWGKEDRQKIQGALDWIANRIFSMRTTMPVPFAYRTLEDWVSLFKEVGFKVAKVRFLGFPNDRDINTPQSVLVLKK